jgi:hypothetical protein
MPGKLPSALSQIVKVGTLKDSLCVNFNSFYNFVVFPDTFKAWILGDWNSHTTLLFADHFSDVKLICIVLNSTKMTFHDSFNRNFFAFRLISLQELFYIFFLRNFRYFTLVANLGLLISVDCVYFGQTNKLFCKLRPQCGPIKLLIIVIFMSFLAFIAFKKWSQTNPFWSNGILYPTDVTVLFEIM